MGLSKHHYYYKSKGGRKGRDPSTHITKIKDDGNEQPADNETVAEAFAVIKGNAETDYGYKATTAALMLLGYVINRKKVYRLMNEWQLLHERPKRARRPFSKSRRVDPTEPLTILEMDIQFQWVTAHQRYAYILTINDFIIRKVLHWRVAYSNKKSQVIAAWQEVIVQYLQPHNMLQKNLTIEVRNDNDGRFAAQMVQEFMRENYLSQVFTRPYTPEENGHNENFHAILVRSLERHSYANLMELETHLQNFYLIYNSVRLNGSLDHLSPEMFCTAWKIGLIKSTEQRNKPTKHKLTVKHYQLSGNGSLRAASGMPAGHKQETQGIRV